MIYYKPMSEEIQAKLAELVSKGWTLANIAREIDQAKRTVEAWNQGKRTPANLKSVLMHLNILAKRKRIPPQKVYEKGSRLNADKEET